MDDIAMFLPANARLPKLALSAAALLAVALGAACTGGTDEFKEVAAERIARPAFMVDRWVDTGPFKLLAWERMHERSAPANIYIEGDGYALSFLKDVSNSPTPSNALALNLASRDHAENLVYLSRPCQFRETPDEEASGSKFWSTRRFSPEVIAAYNTALDEIKLRYDITEFNLIGYDGGANIAAAVAASRKDVASLRTVAGTLNPALVYDDKHEPLDPDTVKAQAIAPQLSSIPQHHFIGAGDAKVTPAAYHSFRQAMGPSECVHYTLVQDADHDAGWVDKWPDLLKLSVECEKPVTPAPLPPVPEYIDHGQK